MTEFRTRTYCTRSGCDSWQFTEELSTGVMVFDADINRAQWFCCWFCIGQYARNFRRPVVIAHLPDDVATIAETIAHRHDH